MQAKDQLVVEPWGEGVRRAASIIADYKRTYCDNSITSIVDATSTNEEAFALKQLMKTAIGSDRIAMLSWSPPGASGDDELLLRANKNPNTRGLAALGISADGLDGLASAVKSGELKMLITFRADMVRALSEEEFVRRFGALDYMLVLSTDANETCQMANQVWPIAAYPEIDGSFTNFKGRVQRINAAFPPPGNAIPGVEAIARLGQAIDGVDRPRSADAIFTAMAAAEPAFKGLSLATLGDHGTDLAAS